MCIQMFLRLSIAVRLMLILRRCVADGRMRMTDSRQVYLMMMSNSETQRLLEESYPVLTVDQSLLHASIGMSKSWHTWHHAADDAYVWYSKIRSLSAIE